MLTQTLNEKDEALTKEKSSLEETTKKLTNELKDLQQEKEGQTKLLESVCIISNKNMKQREKKLNFFIIFCEFCVYYTVISYAIFEMKQYKTYIYISVH